LNINLKLKKKEKKKKVKIANDFILIAGIIILWVGGRQNVALPRAAKCLEPGLSNSRPKG